MYQQDLRGVNNVCLPIGTIAGLVYFSVIAQYHTGREDSTFYIYPSYSIGFGFKLKLTKKTKKMTPKLSFYLYRFSSYGILKMRVWETFSGDFSTHFVVVWIYGYF